MEISSSLQNLWQMLAQRNHVMVSVESIGQPTRTGKSNGSPCWDFRGQTQNICKCLHPWHSRAALGNSSRWPFEEFQHKFKPFFILNLDIHVLCIALGLVLFCRIREHHNVSSVSNIYLHPHIKIFTHHTGVACLILGYSCQKCDFHFHEDS